MSTTAITTTGKKGDLRIAFGFDRVAGYGLPEPIVYLYSQWNKAVMVNIPSVLMHEFDERDRDPITKEPRCMPKCQTISDTIYGQPVAGGAHRVLDALTEWMTDIKNLPPASTFRNAEHMFDEMKRRGYDFIEG